MTTNPNTVVSQGDGVARLMLASGDTCLIDEADLPLVVSHRWHAAVRRRGVYVETNVRDAPKAKQRTVSIHRLLLGFPDATVDHINHDPRDNRRSNLRVASAKQNGRNKRPQAVSKSSKFKGVSWHKSVGKWQAYITVDRKRLYLGYFETEEQAAYSYNRAAELHFGTFACLNVIQNEGFRQV